MSPTFPLVTFSLVLSAFISPSPAMPRHRRLNPLVCEYTHHVFRVTDGVSSWEKYIPTGPTLREAKLDCGQKIAAGLIGSYFVFFTNGKIQSHYLGTFAENRRVLALSDELAVAVAGGYLVSAREGGAIVSTYVGAPLETPKIAISPRLAATVIGRYFAVTDGLQTDKKFVGGGIDTQVVVTDVAAAALSGNYFVGYFDGQMREAFVGNRSPDDQLVADRSLIAAWVNHSFVVLDALRGKILAEPEASEGQVQVQNGEALYRSMNGQTSRYSAATGSFSDSL